MEAREDPAGNVYAVAINQHHGLHVTLGLDDNSRSALARPSTRWHMATARAGGRPKLLKRSLPPEFDATRRDVVATCSESALSSCDSLVCEANPIDPICGACASPGLTDSLRQTCAIAERYNAPRRPRQPPRLYRRHMWGVEVASTAQWRPSRTTSGLRTDDRVCTDATCNT